MSDDLLANILENEDRAIERRKENHLRAGLPKFNPRFSKKERVTVPEKPAWAVFGGPLVEVGLGERSPRVLPYPGYQPKRLAFRYVLGRNWAGEKDTTRRVCFVMLNPSTAGGNVDDPTIRRCVGFARAWGCNALEVVNLFAYRATHPVDLINYIHHDDALEDRAGQLDTYRRNSAYRTRAFDRADIIVTSWGARGTHPRIRPMVDIVRSELRTKGHRVHHLGMNKGGDPKHPLYLAASTRPTEWKP